MKKEILIAIVLTAFAFSGCASSLGREMRYSMSNMKVLVNGVDVERIKNADTLEVVAGIAAELAVHELGHIATMKMVGVKDYEFRGPFRFEYDAVGLSEKDHLWISRSGFIASLLGGTLLTKIPSTRESDFTLGYVGAGAAQTIFYPLPPGNGSDLKNIDRYGGDLWPEYLWYSSWSAVNLWNSIRKERKE